MVGQLISDSGILDGDISLTNITTIGNVRKTNGNKNATFYFKIFKRDSNGTETELAASDPTPPVTSSTYQQFSESALLPINTIFTLTDRVVIRYYAILSGNDNNPTYEFEFGGTDPVRTIFPVAASVVVKSVWSINDNGNDIFYNDGNVGIGTDTPSAKLHSNGTNDTDYLALFTSNGTTPNLSQASDIKRRGVAVQGEGAAYYLGRDLTNNIEFVMGTSTARVAFLGSLTNHGVDIRVKNQNAIRINTAKDVTVTAGHLNINSDSKYLKLGASQDAGITYDGTNMVFDSQLVGAGDFVFENGNVGISTSSPSAKLDVSGDANIDGRRSMGLAS